MNASSAPEPDELATSIQAGMKWGPVNSRVAVNAGFRCEYCGTHMLKDLDTYYSWQIDQIIPGSGYTVDGCALACRTCNHLKHDRIPKGENRAEWLQDARIAIDEKKAQRVRELEQLRRIVGYVEPSIGA